MVSEDVKRLPGAGWDTARSFQEAKAVIHRLLFPLGWFHLTPNIWPEFGPPVSGGQGGTGKKPQLGLKTKA